jgi:hypothetical protein
VNSEHKAVNDEAINNSVTHQVQVEDVPVPMAGQSTVEVHQTSTKDMDVPLASNAPPSTASGMVLIPQYEATSANGTDNDSVPEEPNQDPELTSSPTFSAVTVVPAPLHDTLSQLLSPVSASPVPSTATIPPAPTLTMDDSGPMDVNIPGSATEPTSNPDPVELDEEMGKEAPVPPFTSSVAIIVAPAWLTALNMDVYLQECSDTKVWQGLVQALYKFKEVNMINGVCAYNYIAGSIPQCFPIESTNYLASQRGRFMDQEQEKELST